MRLNVLRLCARRPYTLTELSRVSLQKTPRLEISHYGELSEINVTVTIGECKKRELLVKVGERPSRTTKEGYLEVLRTTLLAFLTSPKLALLEPEAYTAYITAWLCRPPSRAYSATSLGRLPAAEAERLYRLQRELFLIFPGYLHRSFASFAERPGLERAELSGATPEERKRIFGEYYLAGIISAEEAGHRPRIGLERPRLDERVPLPRGQRLKARLLLALAHWPTVVPQERLPIAPVEEEVFLEDRLGPILAI